MFALLFAVLAAHGAHAQHAASAEIGASSDADHFDVFHLRVGALTRYVSPLNYHGISVQMKRYDQAGWHSEAPAVLLLWRSQKRDTLAGTIGEAGVVRVEGRVRVIGDATWSIRRDARTGFNCLPRAVWSRHAPR